MTPAFQLGGMIIVLDKKSKSGSGTFIKSSKGKLMFIQGIIPKGFQLDAVKTTPIELGPKTDLFVDR